MCRDLAYADFAAACGTSGLPVRAHLKAQDVRASVCGSAAGRSVPATIRYTLLFASTPLSLLADHRPKRLTRLLTPGFKHFTAQPPGQFSGIQLISRNPKQ